MKTITELKPLEEIMQQLERHQRIHIIGCGTCATMCHTGGKAEVLAMKEKLIAAGKAVTGWMVVPTTCDPLTRYALEEEAEAVAAADAILVMTCGFGVQTVAFYSDKPVYPALDTMFVGWEESPGRFLEICIQCGQCVLGLTTGICPVTRCAKSLLCGACGGAKEGKCEQKPEHDCVWVLIYERLKKLGMLDKLTEFVPPKDYGRMNIPRQVEVALP